MKTKNKINKLKPTKGEWTLLKGNGTHFATINSGNKRLAEINIDTHKDIDEFESNVKVLASAKDNYDTLLKIQRDISNVFEANVLDGKDFNFRAITGYIGDIVSKAISDTKNK